MKGSKGKDPVEKARRKLAKAHLRVTVAQEKQVQSRARGKQEVERARLRAARWQAEAAERVERNISRLHAAEARVAKLNGTSSSESPADIGLTDFTALPPSSQDNGTQGGARQMVVDSSGGE